MHESESSCGRILIKHSGRISPGKKKKKNVKQREERRRKRPSLTQRRADLTYCAIKEICYSSKFSLSDAYVHIVTTVLG